MSGLSVSVVVYHSDLPQLRATLGSLRDAIAAARELGMVDWARVTVVDNGSADPTALDALAREALGAHPSLSLEIVRGQGNVGYGRGHNLAIGTSNAAYHLVLNPDVQLAPNAIVEASRFLEANPEAGLVAPDVRGPGGERQYLCRRYPSVLVLLLRGFAPRAVRRCFTRYLGSHELRDVIGEVPVSGIPIASGCFMFVRLNVLRAVGGFSPKFFLYFEDFDLSLRLGKQAALTYVPAVRITHAGGGAARKGSRHVMLFLRSAMTFFRTHGWKLV